MKPKSIKDGYSLARCCISKAQWEGEFPWIVDADCDHCKQPIGYDRLFVNFYHRRLHLECWQTLYPERAAADRATRGETPETVPVARQDVRKPGRQS